MRRWSPWRIFFFGVGGFLLGAVVEWFGPRLYPASAAHDCMLWGAIVGLTIGYLPNFVRMGSEITKRQNRPLNLLVGICAFLGVSALVILFVLLALWLASLFYR